MSALMVSSARTTRLGEAAPRSERQMAERGPPASVQWMSGAVLVLGVEAETTGWTGSGTDMMGKHFENNRMF